MNESGKAAIIVQCDHKDNDGNILLVKNDDGSYTCSLCHEKIKITSNNGEPLSAEEVLELATRYNTVFNTLKNKYMSIALRRY